MAAPHTVNNLTDTRCPRCHHAILEETCLCNFVEMPSKSDLRKISNDHWVHDSTSQTLVAYDLRPNELGEWECTCRGYAYNRKCKHLTKLLPLLGVAVVEAPKPKPRILLEDLFDYSKPAPTSTGRVKEAW